ncbi:tripartite motif-containing protein 12A-like [Sminthopsis crassicaudata]|uniref:tripartite motif-containing protein 12A-like n=1 Tax=Sminthopsis crassicaudata TaxID=9301 RepID=UPI003D687556
MAPFGNKKQGQGAEGRDHLRSLEKDPQFDEGVMGLGRLNDGLQNLLTCPVCRKSFTDPITTFSGNTVCLPCVPQGFPAAHINWRMKNAANLFRLLKPRLEELQLVSETWCSKHGEPLTLLCQEDNQRICQVCKYSSLHRAHTLSQIQDPAA